MCNVYEYLPTNNWIDLLQEWMKNKESLLQYMEQVHSGVKGEVTDGSTGQPVQNARVHFSMRNLRFKSNCCTYNFLSPIFSRLSSEEIVKFLEQPETENIGDYWYLETIKWL